MQPLHVAMIIWAWHTATNLWAKNPIAAKDKALFFFGAAATMLMATFACAEIESDRVPWGTVAYMLASPVINLLGGILISNRKSIILVMLHVPVFALAIWLIGQNVK